MGFASTKIYPTYAHQYVLTSVSIYDNEKLHKYVCLFVRISMVSCCYKSRKNLAELSFLVWYCLQFDKQHIVYYLSY
jgi:hypothetical protein